MSKPKLVAIGAGNVATHLVPHLHTLGYQIPQVYSRKRKNAARIAKPIDAESITDLDYLYPVADIYLLMLPDDVIETVAKDLKGRINSTAVVLHCSGSKSSQVLKGASSHYGVVYPLQSFTKKTSINLETVPVFVTGNSSKARKTAKLLGKDISSSVSSLSDEKRKELHLAAVVCNNFVHHLFVKSSDFLSTNRIAFKHLFPLIAQTMENAKHGNLKSKQTGPAKRDDKKTIKEHMSMLESDPEFKKLYAAISKSIKETHA